MRIHEVHCHTTRLWMLSPRGFRQNMTSSLCRTMHELRGILGKLPHFNKCSVLSTFCRQRSLVLALAVTGSTGLTNAHEVNKLKNREIIFRQPELSGIDGNFFVPPADHHYPASKSFNVVLWQVNPYERSGHLVPSRWNIGTFTGFYPSQPIESHQASFRDTIGSSAVQIDSDTVGAYINSKDLGSPENCQKMMITPAFRLPVGSRTRPFASPFTMITTSLDLQVPTAVDQNIPGNYTYVSVTMEFKDVTTGIAISYGVALFHHGKADQSHPGREALGEVVGPFDLPTHSYQVGNPLRPGSSVVSPINGTELFQTLPWRDWKHFEFAVTSDNFAASLAALQKERGFPPGIVPADFEFVEWHLNAEVNCRAAPASLGWSERRIIVSVE